MWVRGLKRDVGVGIGSALGVAPHVGAWIETRFRIDWRKHSSRRSPCGCVD